MILKNWSNLAWEELRMEFFLTPSLLSQLSEGVKPHIFNLEFFYMLNFYDKPQREYEEEVALLGEKTSL